jgi:hypothetical protein
MRQPVRRAEWLAGTAISGVAALAASLLFAAPAVAQTAGPSPGCSTAPLTQTTGNSSLVDGSTSFACVADLNGDGIPELVVGQTGIGERAAGYAVFFSSNGLIKRKTCWTDGNGTITLCPD